MKKIPLTYAISGESLSGKTTSAFQVVSNLRQSGVNAIYVQEAVRESQLYFAGNFGPELCLEIFALNLLLESRSTFHGDVLLLDRCLLDLIAFFAIKYPESIGDLAFQRMKEFASGHLRGHSHIFIVCGQIHNPPGDRFQELDKVDAKGFRKEILRLAADFGLTFSVISDSKDVPDVIYSKIVRDLSL